MNIHYICRDKNPAKSIFLYGGTTENGGTTQGSPSGLQQTGGGIFDEMRANGLLATLPNIMASICGDKFRRSHWLISLYLTSNTLSALWDLLNFPPQIEAILLGNVGNGSGELAYCFQHFCKGSPPSMENPAT